MANNQDITTSPRSTRSSFNKELLKGCFAEFIGMFLFQFLGGEAAANSNKSPASGALGNGFALGSIVAATANLSGGHINPAVSLSLFVVKQINFITLVFYWLSQLMGATMGALALRGLVPVGDEFVIQGSLSSSDPGKVFGLEMFATFALVFIIHALVLDKRAIPGAAPLQISLVVASCVFAVGPFTGGGLNPARAFGPAVAFGDFTAHWAYWIGPLLGGVLAALLHHYYFLPMNARTETPKALVEELDDNIAI